MKLYNRLWVRLMLAFISVTLLTVVTVAAVAGSRATGDFRRYIARRDALAQSGWLDILSAHFMRAGNWQGVETLFSGTIRGGGRGMGMGRPSIVVADADGKIVYDESAIYTGSTLSAEERDSALPIPGENGAIIGYLVALAGHGAGMQPVEQNFLTQLRDTLITAALVAGVVGAAVGLLISRTLTAPLTALTRAAREFAARNWQYRAPIRGHGEITQVEKAFNAMADELQRAEILRRNMMADIAHELRTPLTVMQGNLRAILDDVYPLDRSEIATLYDETRLLIRLVNDLRELALVESGQLPLKVETVDLKAMLQQTLDHFAVAADAQEIKLQLEVKDTALVAQADPERVAQVLHNLVINALRHASGGTVTLAGNPAPDGRSVCASVSDTGDGIAPEDLPHVFDRFYRGDKSRSRGGGNTGLGLAIAKTWVSAMGGQIRVESNIGQGSRFWFTLPGTS